MSETEVATEGAAPQTHAFQADVARLLDLMVHSVYSERDIFLRELISNAADACEKLRYEAIADPALTTDGAPFGIVVTIDKDARRLTVADNGIGMDREDLVAALGTIASSGTRAFLDKIGQSGESPTNQNLIGQFGIGFYSAFMVADHVVVETRRAGTEQAWRWTSDGKGSYEIEALALDAAPARGTRVILAINAASDEFLESYRVEHLIREHSGAVAVPIAVAETADGEAKAVSDGAALWAKSKADITPEQYTEFYRGLGGHFDEPALTIHWRAEGRHEYNVLAFIPGSKPFDLFDPARKGKAKLYVRRVLISSDADLLPGWLRFVKLVVDTADLPLNMSRELIQQSPIFAAIKKGVTNRVLQDLTKLADSDAEKFKSVWENFGAVLKEGLYEDPEKRDALFKLARFASSTHPDGGRTLADYLAGLRPNQTAIYYLLGDDHQAPRHQPAARRVPRARHRGAVAARPRRRLLGFDGHGDGRQALQVGDPGRGGHQARAAGRWRGGAGDHRRHARGRHPARLHEADLGGVRGGRTRVRPAVGKPGLPHRARIRPRSADGADHGPARTRRHDLQARAGDQPPASPRDRAGRPRRDRRR